MDLGNPWLIVSGALIGLVGMILLNRGRKEPDLKALGTGLVLCVYPYFVGSVLVVWLLFGAVMAGYYVLNRWTT